MTRPLAPIIVGHIKTVLTMVSSGRPYSISGPQGWRVSIQLENDLPTGKIEVVCIMPAILTEVESEMRRLGHLTNRRPDVLIITPAAN